MTNLNGSSALVTGGASGLGAATTRKLAEAGARVVVADLPHHRERVESEFGRDVLFVPVDVTDEEQMRAAVAAASELGPLRVAVACAGVGDPHRLIGSKGPLDLATLRRTLEVNFVGTVSMLAHAAEAMSGNDLLGDDRGVVVMTASIAGLDSASVGYGGSKAAVAGITLAAARELASRAVRVVTIAPGLFETPMLAGMHDTLKSAFNPTHPGRVGRPEEFASLVGHIVDNAMLNGEVIRLDAGLRTPARSSRRADSAIETATENEG